MCPAPQKVLDWPDLLLDARNGHDAVEKIDKKEAGREKEKEKAVR